MDSVNYYVTTLTNAAKVIGPYVLFLVGGYLLFIKMPFLFLKKSMDTQKKKLSEESKGLELVGKKDYGVEDYNEFKRKLKLMNNKTEKQEAKQERKQSPNQEKKQESKRAEQKKEEVKKPAPTPTLSPEEILGFKPNEPFTKAELKKRYFDLLKQNHPDRVATMGLDFKILAEKNTKEINRAYDKLKSRAA